MELNDVAAVVLFDSVNIRYATDTTNMQVWGHHNPVRYVLVPVQGPVIVFDATTMMHLYDNAEMIDEVNVCIPWTYFTAGPRFEEFADAWAQQITGLVKEHCGSKNRIASDRINPFGVRAIEKRNFTLIEGQGFMEHARVIKSDDEIGAIRCAIAAAEDGIEKMRSGIRTRQVRKRSLVDRCINEISNWVVNGWKVTFSRAASELTRGFRNVVTG